MKLYFYFHIGLLLAALLLRLGNSNPNPPFFSCDEADPRTKSFKFCDQSLPIAQRARDLVSRLTLDEKISQLVHNSAAIPRLGVPMFKWWSEALHGVSGHPLGGVNLYTGAITGATSFPQVILAAATFDSKLWYNIGRAIGREARGLYNGGQALGMTFWTPNINIFRDPRWGRGQETPGEDPLVAAKYAVAQVRGLQGDKFEGGQNGNHLLVSACCKHFTAYDLDIWGNVSRMIFDAKVTQQDMADMYMPPLRSCVQEAKGSGLMCSYNKVNGIPGCADRNILTKIARKQWGFRGYVQKAEDAVALALNAGVDVNCGTYFKNYTKSAIQQKKVHESQVDRALHNLFQIRMRLGLFGGNPNRNPYGNIGRAEVCSRAHQDLALEAARDGIVLLKNDAHLLPLSKSGTRSLAVVGPRAANVSVLRGNYDGPPCRNVSILDALEGYVSNTMFEPACSTVGCWNASTMDAVDVAKKADYVVLVMGLDLTLEAESHDRAMLGLPCGQESLVMAVAAAAKKPVVLVLLGGGPIDVEFAKNDPKIGSILWVGYPGEAGGSALSQIMFGDHNPGGKLPMTWYPKSFISVPMTDMRMRPDPKSSYPGRTYRFYTGPKVFEFGYGLSYTSYSYNFKQSTHNTINLSRFTASFYEMDEGTSSNSSSIKALSISKIGVDNCERLKFSTHVGVENIGSMAGKHPVLLFARHERRGGGRPMKQLVGFETVSLKPKQKTEIEFVLNPCEHFSRANVDGSIIIEEGYRYLMVEDKEFPIKIVLE